MKGPNLAQHVPQVNCCFSCKRKKLTYDPGPSFSKQFRWLITAYFLKEKKTRTRLSKKIFFKPKKIVHHWLGLAFQKILF